MNQALNESFADLLRFYRRRSGLSQADLAAKAGLSSREISDLERGVRSRAYLPTVEALASALMLSVEERGRFAAAVHRARLSQRAAGKPFDLPRPSSPLIDREDELSLLKDLLLNSRERIVSLTGPPGCGKTRLALELGLKLSSAGEMTPRYISLASLARPHEITAVAARALETIEPVADANAEGFVPPPLLILDNLEHLLPVKDVLGDLKANEPELSLLVVSRVGTQSPGEQMIVLSPIPRA